MSVVFAFAGPAIMRGLSGLTLKTTAKKVAGALRYARSQAVNRSQTYSVIFDRDKSRIVVRSLKNSSAAAPDETLPEEATAEETEGADRIKQREQGELKVFSLPEGISLKEVTIGGKEVTDTREEVAQLFFFPNGTSQGGEVFIADTRERAFIVAVDFLTGVVTLAEKEA